MNGYIELITGTLGGGKTAFAVEKIYDHLKSGGFVYTNIEVYPDEVEKRLAVEGLVFDRSRLVILLGDAREYSSQVSRGTTKKLVMLVVDEAGLDLNARDWAKTDKKFIAFNTMARKLDIHLIYISQDASDVDKQIRRKAELVWVCRNLKKQKIWGVIPFPLPFYFRVCFDNTRGGGTSSKMYPQVVLKPSSWGLYNSNAMVGEVASQWVGMNQVDGSALEKLEHVRQQKRTALIEIIVILCVSFYVSF